VFLFGLGKLKVVERGQKLARNIHTGESVIVPPRKVVVLQPSDPLTEAANGGK
jgi:nucleoid DNA-binding protein